MQDLSHGVRGAAERSRPWVVGLGRAGYLARAVLYLTIGILAGMVAFGQGGKLADGRGALDELSQQPFGVLLLVLMSIGLAGYGVWRGVQAILDPGSEAGAGWGWAKRGAWLMGALLHFGLAAYAFALLVGNGGQDNMDARSGTASALDAGPLGPVIVMGVGLGLLGLGIYEMSCVWRAKLDQQLDLSPLSTQARRRIVLLSRFGIFARSVVFTIAGGFMLIAGVTSDASQAKGFGESLQALQGAPFGKVLLGAVALGLLAFAVYQVVEARYRRVLGSSSSGAIHCWTNH
jgi:hypothetical protein